MDTDELLKRYADGKRDFRGVILRGQSLHEADLSGIDLRESDLSGVRFIGVNLSRANLVPTLRGANEKAVSALELMI